MLLFQIFINKVIIITFQTAFGKALQKYLKHLRFEIE